MKLITELLAVVCGRFCVLQNVGMATGTCGWKNTRTGVERLTSITTITTNGRWEFARCFKCHSKLWSVCVLYCIRTDCNSYWSAER